MLTVLKDKQKLPFHPIDLSVPGSPPLNFTLTPLTSTSITASWEEPPLQHQNGNITGYILFYKEKLLRSEPYSSIATTDLKLTLFGLKVFTEYTFRVLAYNENGNGIATEERYIYTKESSMFFFNTYCMFSTT